MKNEIENQLKKRDISFKFIKQNGYFVTLTNENTKDVLHIQQTYPEINFITTNMRFQK